jgi:hypothetical protein
MRRFLDGCSHHRAGLRLPASGALQNEERALIGHHLAACAGCRKYYDEVNRLASALAGWEMAFSHIEVNQAIQARWAKDFEAATRAVHSARFAFIFLFLDWCHDLIWPCRRVWAGFAVVWLVILALNIAERDPAPSPARAASQPSPEMVGTYFEREGLPAEWAELDAVWAAKPSKR